MYFWFLFNFTVIFITFLTTRRSIYLIWIFLALFSAFRYNIGPDYLQYALVQEKILSGSEFFLLASDFFHIQLVYFADYIGAKLQFVILIYSFLTMFFYYKAFKYFSINNTFFIISTALFIAMIYFGTLNTIRQTLAAAIFFYSVRFIIERKLLWYMIFTFIAILVHKSAIVLLPLYWISNLILKRRTVIIIFVLLVMLIFINPISFIGAIFVKFNIPFADYFSYGRFSEPPTLYIKLTAFINLIMLSLLNLLDRNNRQQNIIFNFVLMMVFVRTLALHMDVIGRLAFYFKPLHLLLLVYVIFFMIKNIASAKNMLIVSIFIIIFSFSLVQLKVIIGKANAYEQYALNFNLFSAATPIQIFGDYKKVQKWEK